jgi:hypothetical protein
MKSILTKGLLASAAALAIAGAFAQVQTGEPTNGSKLGVTPPPSSSATTDTSRLSSDCGRVAADQRSNQPPHDPMMLNCGHAATIMGAAPAPAAQPAVVGSTSSSTTTSSAAAAPADTGTNVAAADTTPAPKKHKARADRG